jgi:hypothetical protein
MMACLIDTINLALDLISVFVSGSVAMNTKVAERDSSYARLRIARDVEIID